MNQRFVNRFLFLESRKDMSSLEKIAKFDASVDIKKNVWEIFVSDIRHQNTHSIKQGVLTKF